MSSLDEAVTQVLAGPVRERSGLLVDAVSVTTAGRRRVVRVVVDLPDPEPRSPGADDADEVEPAGLDLDAVARASEAVSETLDASDVLGEAPYTLEVSSPGVDRPLTVRRHWARARGRLVRAVLADGSTPVGRVVEVDDAGVLVHLEPQPVKGRMPRAKDVGVPRVLTWAELVRGEVQVEFRRDDDQHDDQHDDQPDDSDDELDDDDIDDDIHDSSSADEQDEDAQ